MAQFCREGTAKISARQCAAQTFEGRPSWSPVMLNLAVIDESCGFPWVWLQVNNWSFFYWRSSCSVNTICVLYLFFSLDGPHVTTPPPSISHPSSLCLSLCLLLMSRGGWDVKHNFKGGLRSWYRDTSWHPRCCPLFSGVGVCGLILVLKWPFPLD